MMPYILAGSLLLAALAGFQGYRMGVAQSEARHVLEMRRDADEAVTIERDRLETEKQAILMSQVLEDQAYEQPAQINLCLPADRVVRLNRR